MTNSFSNEHLIGLVLKWRKRLLIIAGSTAIITAVICLFIKDQFTSYSILYPANMQAYSVETPTEHLLQLLESSDVREEVCSKLNLAKHYELDTNKATFQSDLKQRFEKNVNIGKTQYESVRLETTDADPAMALNMNLAILKALDNKAQSLQRAKTQEICSIIKEQLDLKKVEMDSMENAIKAIRVKYGIIDFATQTKEASKSYFKMITKGTNTNTPAFKELDGIVRNLEEKGGEYVSLSEHLWKVRGDYNKIKVDYEIALKDLTKQLTYTNIITSPVKPDKKSYPMRSLIVLIATCSALIFSILIISLVEAKKHLNKQ